MTDDFLVGFATSFALIVAIGSQNAFVLRQGIRREHVLAVVVFCALSDALLILLGIGGAGAVVRGKEGLLSIARYGGALFLASYGAMALRRAYRGGQMLLKGGTAVTLSSALAACFAFTYLNPHVYLDTMVLLGAVANQRGDAGRWVFGAGACLASLLWFSALGWGARWLGPLFETVTAWRVLDAFIAVVMFSLAGMLLLG
jgi:L-lysine exporter family protein LysE/ArgO